MLVSWDDVENLWVALYNHWTSYNIFLFENEDEQRMRRKDSIFNTEKPLKEKSFGFKFNNVHLKTILFYRLIILSAFT